MTGGRRCPYLHPCFQSLREIIATKLVKNHEYQLTIVFCTHLNNFWALHDTQNLFSAQLLFDYTLIVDQILIVESNTLLKIIVLLSHSFQNTVLGVNVLFQYPFSSSMQRMSVITEVIGGDGELTVYMKGAPEMVASFCRPETGRFYVFK